MNAHMRTEPRYGAWRRAGVAAAHLLIAAAVAGCDFSVTNPGPVDDAFLDDPAAHAAVVNGMGRDLADALNWISYTTAAVSREIHPSGSTGSFGISPLQQVGIMEYDDLHMNPAWENAQRARWVAADGILRLQETLGAAFDSNPLAVQAYVWSGYANRLLGENMCEAVIDGGGIEPRTRFLELAEEAFTRAIQLAPGANRPDLATVARAGRAAVRVHLGNWGGAVEDASGIADDFVYQMPYHSIGVLAQANRIFHATEAAPYKAHTVWNTLNEEYYEETGDPRVPYRWTDEVGDAAVANLGTVPWFPQQKYTSRASPINLSSGREMRLIEAEALLRDGNWLGAMEIVNAIRTSVTSEAGTPLTPWVVTNEAEAWTAFIRERGIELWLEGRRMGDFRRWLFIDNRPTDYFHPLEIEGGELPLRPLAERLYCYPIPLAERETNPNVPLLP